MKAFTKLNLIRPYSTFSSGNCKYSKLFLNLYSSGGAVMRGANLHTTESSQQRAGDSLKCVSLNLNDPTDHFMAG